MIPFWKKTSKHSKPQSAQKRRQNAKPAVPWTAQQSIPMQRMFEDGTCRVKPGLLHPYHPVSGHQLSVSAAGGQDRHFRGMVQFSELL